MLADDLPRELPEGAPIYNVGHDPRQTRSYLIVPMTTGGRVIGSVQLQSYEPGFYTLADAAPLAAVAGHAASALENTWLLEAAAGRARRSVFASYPRDRAAVRSVLWLQNLGFALFRKRFRVFAHPPADLERAAERRGLRRTRVARTFVWETAQFDVASGA